MTTRSAALLPVIVLALVGFPSLGQPIGDREEMPASAKRNIEFARQLSDAFQFAASHVENAVVHITTKATVQGVRRDIFGRTIRVGDPRVVETGLGSGVIIDQAGLVLTNNHVISDGDTFVVRLRDGREYEAELVGRDASTDLAVLNINGEDFTAAEFSDSDELNVGEWVIAVGSPFGFAQTVTAGIVSAKGRGAIGTPGEDGQYQEYIQTDAAINPGNSGGPLVNLEGQIVGINSAILSRGGGSVGIGFAVPANVARGVVDQLLENGRVERGYLGVVLEPLGPTAQRQLGLDAGYGALFDSIVVGSPADRAGLRDGDVVLRINDRDVVGVGDEVVNRARNLISLTPPGGELKVDVIRDGAPQTVRARLGDDLDREAAQWLPQGGDADEELRVVIVPMNPAISRELGYRRAVEGDLIVYADPDGPAARGGLKQWDVLVERTSRRSGELELEILRSGDRGTVTVNVDD